MKKAIILIISFVFIIGLANAESFVAGKDYTVINKSAPQQKQVSVTEFFNYGCPWCDFIEKSVEGWQKTVPSYVDFNRVPLTFEQGWTAYARAYYLAVALGIEKDITPKLFLAIHGPKDTRDNDLSSPQAITAFFVKHGAKKSQVEKAFNSGSPSLEAQVQYGSVLMKQYKVWAIPTFVVAEKYSVNLSQAKKSDRMIQILNYLIKKSHK
jgi:thiol:disulfide interchange protein DsbA